MVKKKDIKFLKGTSITELKMCKWVQVGEVKGSGDDVAVAHVDMGPEFWRKHHPYVFNRR